MQLGNAVFRAFRKPMRRFPDGALRQRGMGRRNGPGRNGELRTLPTQPMRLKSGAWVPGLSRARVFGALAISVCDESTSREVESVSDRVAPLVGGPKLG